MITANKSSLGYAAFLLLLLFISQGAVKCVSAKNYKILRGYKPAEIKIQEVPNQRMLGKEKKDKHEKNKDDKKKDSRTGVATIEEQVGSTPSNANADTSLGRDDIGSPTGSSDSLWSLENSKDISTESSSVTDGSGPSETDKDNIFEAVPTETSELTMDDSISQATNVEFDGTNFVAGEKLKPITFDIHVSEFSDSMDSERMTSYFKDFIEEILDMRSNMAWYPFHSKSMHNLTIDLFPIDATEGDQTQIKADHIPMQLILNGFVFVHSKVEDVGMIASLTRSAAGRASQQKLPANDISDTSTFYDSFDHSMLLYLTFWGVESLQTILEEDGGLQNPVVDSISVGANKLLAFGVDKDDNYMYNGDHDSSRPKNLQAKAVSSFGDKNKSSSARASKFGLLTFITVIVSAACSII